MIKVFTLIEVNSTLQVQYTTNLCLEEMKRPSFVRNYLLYDFILTHEIKVKTDEKYNIYNEWIN